MQSGNTGRKAESEWPANNRADKTAAKLKQYAD